MFDGDPDNPATTEVMDKISRTATDTSETRLVVASQAICLGVNFFPRCGIISLVFPSSKEGIDQLSGRSNRTDPNGPRVITLGLHKGQKVTDYELLEKTLAHKHEPKHKATSIGKYKYSLRSSSSSQGISEPRP